MAATNEGNHGGGGGSSSGSSKWAWLGGGIAAAGACVGLGLGLGLGLGGDTTTTTIVNGATTGVPYPTAPCVQTDPILPCQLQPLFDSMTLDAKLGQMNQFTTADITGPTTTVPWQDTIPAGQCGSIFNINNVTWANQLQQQAVDATSIPLLIGYDTIHGYKTIFPINLGLAATFDRLTVEESFAVASQEAKADGIHQAFTPMVDVSRDSRWGRMSESHGEDPYLSGQMARAAVRGLQERPAEKLRSIGCVKHYAGYGGAESGRDYNLVDMSMAKWFNEYLPPYKDAVEAGVKSIMTSFNTLNYLPATANDFLLTDVLKDAWGFKGLVVTDYGAVMELTHHLVAGDWPEAGMKAANAGVDMEMAAGVWYYYLKDLVNNGQVSQDRIDDAVKRILRVKWEAGLFDENGRATPETYLTDASLNAQWTLTTDNLNKARLAAHKSTVLLKNENQALPMRDLKGKKVLVVGPLAGSSVDTIGGWSGQGAYNEAGEAIVSALAGLQNTYGASNVDYAYGTAGMVQQTLDSDHQPYIDEAVAKVQSGDYSLVISVFGESANMSGEATSRVHLEPCCGQRPMMLQIGDALDKMGTDKPVHVGVLYSGRGMTIEHELNTTDAFFHAWFPGTSGGNALGDLISGKVVPGGRLPITIPRDVGQCPIYYGRPPTGRPILKDVDSGYNEVANGTLRYLSRYIDNRTVPLFPFGFGLSYSTFRYDSVKVSPSSMASNMPLNTQIDVTAVVTNTGSYDADEVVQLYIHDIIGAVSSRPVQQLKGFERVHIKAGESKSVKFALHLEDLGFYSEIFEDNVYSSKLQFGVEPGEFEIFIGPNADPGWDPNWLSKTTVPGVSTTFTLTEVANADEVIQPKKETRKLQTTDDILPAPMIPVFEAMDQATKLGQLNQFSANTEISGPADTIDWEEAIKAGDCGSVFNINDVAQLNAVQAEAMAARENTGVPLIAAFDTIHGYASIFPINLGMAASFDPDMVQNNYFIAANESLNDGIRMLFIPMLDISRDSRWGRMSESHGEDPYLDARMGEAVVKGIMTPQESGKKAIACVKHYAAYGGGESGRDYNLVEMSMQRLWNEYLPAYKAAIDAGAESVMASFNSLNGVPATSNNYLMTQVLKEEWGFKGLIVTDYNGMMELERHQVAADDAEAGMKAMNAGIDMEMAYGILYFNLKQLVDDGRVSQERVDDAVKRVLRLKYNAGLYDDNGQIVTANVQTDETLTPTYTAQASYLDATRDAAEKTTVLLKNFDNALPKTDLGGKKILVLGTLANSDIDTIGGWAGVGGTDAYRGNIYSITKGLKEVYGQDNVVWMPAHQGLDQAYTAADHQALTDAAVAELSKGGYSMVISVVGEAANMSGEATSRTDLNPCCGQSEFVNQINATILAMADEKPIHVGILMAGRGMTVENEVNKTQAFLHAWFPGTRGGLALARLLHGDASPSGRLPITMPRHVGQCPIYYGRPPTGRPTDLTQDTPYMNDAVKYTSRYIDVRTSPLFPFGFGLTYSKWDYTGITVSPTTGSLSALGEDAEVTVTATVTNSGTVAASEVAQFYIHQWVGMDSRPVRELKGFQKIQLNAGESQQVSFKIKLHDLGYYRVTYSDAYTYDNKWTIETGDFEMFVGPCAQPDWDTETFMAQGISMGVASNFTLTA